MNFNTIILFALLGILTLSSCSKEELKEGVNITLRNTLEEDGTEQTYASLFGASDAAFDETATLSNSSVEFASALAQDSTATGLPFNLGGLYEIDLTENSIKFQVLPDETTPFWSNVLGLFPAGKVDRYYFTFSEPHNISGFESENSFLNLRIDSETVVVVELKEGYDLQPGVSFSVNLN